MQPEEIVLIHGWGMNAVVWHPFLPYLEDYHVTLVELPGHGKQAWSEEHTSLQSWSDAVLEQAPERAVWCGWSLGGQVAMQAALSDPGRISGLVLMTSTPSFVQRGGWSHAMEANTLEQFSAQLKGNIDGTLNRFLTLQVRGAGDMRSTLNQLRTALASRPRADEAALETGLSLLLQNDLRAEVGHIEQPQLWLQGERDTLVPSGVVHAVEPLSKCCRVDVISGAAHAPFLSHPHYCADQLNRFMHNV